MAENVRNLYCKCVSVYSVGYRDLTFLPLPCSKHPGFDATNGTAFAGMVETERVVRTVN